MTHFQRIVFFIVPAAAQRVPILLFRLATIIMGGRSLRRENTVNLTTQINDRLQGLEYMLRMLLATNGYPHWDHIGDTLLGQSGVGFYPASYVTDNVSVTTKSKDDATQHVWESIADVYPAAQVPEFDVPMHQKEHIPVPVVDRHGTEHFHLEDPEDDSEHGSFQSLPDLDLQVDACRVHFNPAIEMLEVWAEEAAHDHLHMIEEGSATVWADDASDDYAMDQLDREYHETCQADNAANDYAEIVAALAKTRSSATQTEGEDEGIYLISSQERTLEAKSGENISSSISGSFHSMTDGKWMSSEDIESMCRDISIRSASATAEAMLEQTKESILQIQCQRDEYRYEVGSLNVSLNERDELLEECDEKIKELRAQVARLKRVRHI